MPLALRSCSTIHAVTLCAALGLALGACQGAERSSASSGAAKSDAAPSDTAESKVAAIDSKLEQAAIVLEPVCGTVVFARSEPGEHGATGSGFYRADAGQPQMLGGEPEHAGEHGHGAPEASRFPAAVSPDGAQLLVLVSTPTPSGKTADALELWSLREPGAGGKALEGMTEGAMIRLPSFSPDGSYIVFESDASSFRDLYRYDFARAETLRLTDDPKGNFEPAIDPGGQRLAFVSSRDGDPELYVMGGDGGGATRLTQSPGDDSSPRWSPDGSTLAFLSTRDRARGWDLYLMPAEGGPARALVERDRRVTVRDHAWSPDGRHLAWIELGAEPGLAPLVVVEVETGKQVLRTAEAGVDQQPAWSPDGGELVFSRGQGAGRSTLMRLSLEGGMSSLAPLFGTQGTAPIDWLPRWAPDSSCPRVAPPVVPAPQSSQG